MIDQIRPVKPKETSQLQRMPRKFSRNLDDICLKAQKTFLQGRVDRSHPKFLGCIPVPKLAETAERRIRSIRFANIDIKGKAADLWGPRFESWRARQ